tara:strand:- start:1115 stop:1375 length:261 start_codon:yes stop_codon:yes gene_type:complete
MNDVAIVVDMCLNSLAQSMRTMNYTSITTGQVKKFVNHLAMIQNTKQEAWLKQTLTTLLEVMETQNRKDISVADIELLIEVNKEHK